MALLSKASLRDRMRVQFAEAGFEIGFGLVDMAEAELIQGNCARAARIIADADNVLSDIQQTLCRMTASDNGPFVPLIGELHRAINLTRLHLARRQT
jgi:hypothetical protein